MLLEYGSMLLMEPGLEKQLKELIGHLKCPKDFKCCTEGLEDLCKARDIGLETFAECLEVHPLDCPFSMRLANVNYCKCTLRVYIAKKLGK
jgi:hypothetical protein